MPSQQAEIAETITALRKARDRDRKAPSTKPIYSATNRGNKLYRGANHVHSGVLAYTYGPETYKEKIEHGGYPRYILERNPKRYDGYGNELEYSDSDEEADADAADENPYDGILIEELLCPLKNPADLSNHPSLSLPYLDPALDDMIESTEDKLRAERANLWRAKNLNRHFIGDVSWLPCAAVESNNEWDLFEPRKLLESRSSRKRKRNPESRLDKSHATDAPLDTIMPDGPVESIEADPTPFSPKEQPLVGDGEASEDPSGGAIMEQTEKTSEEPAHPPRTEEDRPAKTNGTHNPFDSVKVNGEALDDEASKEETEIVDEKDVEQTSDATSPPPPSRRITRALAANNHSVSHSNAPTPPLSPTVTLTDSTSSSLYEVDPIFLLPLNLPISLFNASNTIAGGPPSLLSILRPDEIAETRKLLMLYIQKQEESVRGYEAVMAKLIHAKRLRDQVFEMCKAEGHVGELSDGEDWIDLSRWGLQPGELRKGRDEEDAENGNGGDGRGGGDGEGERGGRKGKRRRN